MSPEVFREPYMTNLVDLYECPPGAHQAAITYQPDDAPWIKRKIINALELLYGRRQLEHIYRRLRAEKPPLTEFFGRALALGGVSVRLDKGQLAKIPKQGPLIFIANHPFGVVDGLIACDIASRYRGDFKVVLNAMLCRDEYLSACYLPISFEETPEALHTNLATKQAARDLLAHDGTLVIFPAGGVSTRGKFGMGKLEDLPWSTFVAKLALQSRATIVPIYFHGENSRKFHVASSISATLRTSLLLAEVSNKLNKSINVAVGDPRPYADYADVTRRDLTRMLYDWTFALGKQGEEPQALSVD